MRYRLNVFSTPLLCNRVSKNFRALESLGKILERSFLRFGHFFSKWSKIAALKKVLTDFFPLFTPFKPLFAPTFWSPMSKLFRFYECLGENNGKKWSHIWILLLIKGVKLPHTRKRLNFHKYALLAGFFWYRCYNMHRSRHESRMRDF